MEIHVKNKRYAQVPEGAMEDTRISATAYRLLSALYKHSFPVENSTDRKVSLSRIVNMGNSCISKNTYYTAIKELVAAGWVREPHSAIPGEATTYFLPAHNSGEVEYTPSETSLNGGRIRKAVLALGYDDDAVVHASINVYDNDTTFYVEGDEQVYNLNGEGMGKVKSRTKKCDKVVDKQNTPRTNNRDTVETPKEETKVVRKPIKRTLKKVSKPVSAKQDTPTVKENTPRPKKQDKPIFERGYNMNTHTGTQPRPTTPAAPVVEEKPTVFKRLDSGEECGPLHLEKPAQYKLVNKLDERGNVVDSWIVDKVTVLEDGCTELDHFFMQL